ncbi:MAG: hypothetical protein HQM08_30245 [Candidatus Riflebacteria bacterium]|nr:hypothetical protein [Candidatus Riflebacteria bacterium]
MTYWETSVFPNIGWPQNIFLFTQKNRANLPLKRGKESVLFHKGYLPSHHQEKCLFSLFLGLDGKEVHISGNCPTKIILLLSIRKKETYRTN